MCVVREMHSVCTSQVLKETEDEYLLLEESFRDMSEEQVNRTLNESQMALQVLQTEADSLLELTDGAVDESAHDIAQQMRLIQRKQRELLRMQFALHQRLAARSQKRKSRRGVARLRQSPSRSPPQHKRVDSLRTCSLNVRPCALDDAFSAEVRSSENVVDVSPIIDVDKTPAAASATPLCAGIVDVSPIPSILDDAIQETPRPRDTDAAKMDTSPVLVYTSEKPRRALLQPFESTASESVHESRRLVSHESNNHLNSESIVC